MDKIIDKQKEEIQLRLKSELKEEKKKVNNYFKKYSLEFNNNYEFIERQFIESFLLKYRFEYPTFFSDEKILENANVNFSLLNILENNIQKITDEIEYNNPIINLTIEQSNEIKSIQKIINTINELNQNKTIDEIILFIREIGRNISLDDGKLSVNTNYILNKKYFSRC